MFWGACAVPCNTGISNLAPPPPCFCCLFASKNGMVNTWGFFFWWGGEHLKHYFVSPGWNKGLNLKDWVQHFAEMAVI